MRHEHLLPVVMLLGASLGQPLRAEATLKPSLIANKGKEDAELKLVDLIIPVGNILVRDANTKAILSLLTSPGHSFMIKAGTSVEIYLLPSSKSIALNLQLTTESGGVHRAKYSRGAFSSAISVSEVTQEKPGQIQFEQSNLEKGSEYKVLYSIN